MTTFTATVLCNLTLKSLNVCLFLWDRTPHKSLLAIFAFENKHILNPKVKERCLDCWHWWLLPAPSNSPELGQASRRARSMLWREAKSAAQSHPRWKQHHPEGYADPAASQASGEEQPGVSGQNGLSGPIYCKHKHSLIVSFTFCFHEQALSNRGFTQYVLAELSGVFEQLIQKMILNN